MYAHRKQFCHKKKQLRIEGAMQTGYINTISLKEHPAVLMNEGARGPVA